MDNSVWNNRFLETLFAKFPKKPLLIKALMNLLHIEREAAYRRLRNQVDFSIHEIVKISSAWNISLDEISGNCSRKISFLMQPIDYVDPSEKELRFLQYIVKSINELKNFPDAEFMDICNKLPRQFLAGYRYLYQFHLFKCVYNYCTGKKPVPYGKVNISEEKQQLIADYNRVLKTVPNTNYIFDPLIIDHLVNDIQYFHSIQMISGMEIKLIKTDLHALLDYLSEVATKGCYPETQKKVNLYISYLNVDTNYSYTFTNRISISLAHVFDKYEIYTHDVEIAPKFKVWMQLMKRSSIQISEVGQKSRIEFFAKQQKLIDKL